MDYCAKCGHELDVGRYCTNCGHPVGTLPDAPPPAWTPPPPARFPLYADEVGPPEQAPTSHRRRPWGPWLAIAAVLALVAVVGVVLTTGGDDDPSGGGRADHGGHHGGQGDGQGGGQVTNLAVDATATVPATAAPGRDVNGEPVTFDAGNMLDGVPETAWRMPGDGTGEEIVVTLPHRSRLRSVGLINGYAKLAPGRDWYHGNRRIEQVQWVFDDGTTVDQDLLDKTGVQSVEVDVAATAITLRLVAVSKPGTGPDRRDNTVISDLSIVGGV